MIRSRSGPPSAPLSIAAGPDAARARSTSSGRPCPTSTTSPTRCRFLRTRRATPFDRTLLDLLDTAPWARSVLDDSVRMVDPLSTRELDVLRCLSSRLTTSEISGELFISVNTLKTHTKAIYRKLGVANRNEAVRTARDLGLL